MRLVIVSPGIWNGWEGGVLVIDMRAAMFSCDDRHLVVTATTAAEGPLQHAQLFPEFRIRVSTAGL